jgi:DNA gyrase subunit A
MARISGPDFPTGALIMGRKGIEDAYRTGRGLISMRAVVTVEEIQNRTCLVVTELPYQVNPGLTGAEDRRAGQGRAAAGDRRHPRRDVRASTGQRLVIVLKRDAVAKVVLNNLYKHTPLQTTFGANMLALVDGVPRTLPIDAFIRHWVEHQIEVIQRRTTYRLRKAEERASTSCAVCSRRSTARRGHRPDPRSRSVDEARTGLMAMLDIDEIEQAQAILDMPLRRLAALERQKIIEQHDEIEAEILDFQDILAKPGRQRTIISDELAEIVKQVRRRPPHHDRALRRRHADGGPHPRGGCGRHHHPRRVCQAHSSRTEYRSQRRGGKGVRGAQLRGEDVVSHFFTTTSHHWLLFFTNLGRVYRAKAYELPDAGRDAKGQHVANLLAFQPDGDIAAVLAIHDYEAAPYLVLATERGLVKKTRLAEFDSPRSGGVIAINLRDGDHLVGAGLVDNVDDLLLVSRKGQSARFAADDTQLRPMGRATSGVTGMKFRAEDSLLSMSVIPAGTDPDVFVVFESGLAKRSKASEWSRKGRGILGVAVAKLSERGGDLVGALTVSAADEVLVVMEKGNIVRSRVDEVRLTGRNTMGVSFATPRTGDAIVAVARSERPPKSRPKAGPRVIPLGRRRFPRRGGRGSVRPGHGVCCAHRFRR